MPPDFFLESRDSVSLVLCESIYPGISVFDILIVCVSVKRIPSFLKRFLNLLSSHLSLVNSLTFQTRNVRLFKVIHFSILPSILRNDHLNKTGHNSKTN